MHASVPQQPQAAGVACHDAAHLRAALCAEIEREDVLPLGEVIIGDFEHDASVGDEDAGDVVEAADLGHARHAQHNLVKYGHGAADEARVAALRHDRQHVLAAVLEDIADLLRAVGPQHQLRLAQVLAHPVRVVALEVRAGVGGHAVNDLGPRAQQRAEVLDVCCRQLAEAGVALEVGVATHPSQSAASLRTALTKQDARIRGELRGRALPRLCSSTLEFSTRRLAGAKGRGARECSDLATRWSTGRAGPHGRTQGTRAYSKWARSRCHDASSDGRR